MAELDVSAQQELIGFVLGTLSEDERAEFEAKLYSQPELRGQVEALRRRLAPLAAWQVEEPPADLADRIMARVATTTPLKYVAERVTMPPEREPSAASRRPFATLNELVALAACLAIIVGIMFPGVTRRNHVAVQARCAQNLAAVAGGFGQYAAMFGGQPRVYMPPPNNFIRRPMRNHMAPVIQIRLIVPAQLVCPTQTGEIPTEEEVRQNVGAFLNNVHFRFYSVQNPNGPATSVANPSAMPMLADPNPMFTGGRYVPKQADANSYAHRGRGQNTLFQDGSVQFLPTPVIGNPSDNIWRAEDIDNYTGTETPSAATDAFLVP